MAQGECVLLSNLMLHRSDPNTSGKPRRGLSLWFTPEDNPALARIFPDYIPKGARVVDGGGAGSSKL